MRILADQPRSKFLYIGVLLLGLLTVAAAFGLNRPVTSTHQDEALMARLADPDDTTGNPYSLEPSAELLWQQTLGSQTFEYANALLLQNTGTILIAGNQYDPNNSASDSLVLRTLADGSLVSAAALEGDGEDTITSLASMPDGTVYAAGQKGYMLSVVRLLDNGDANWVRTYALDGPSIANDLAISATGDLLVAGSTKVRGDGLLLRLDDQGTQIWNRRFPTGAAYAVAADSQGGTILGGQSEGQAILLSYDASGNERWRLAGGEIHSDRIDALSILSDGSSLIAGTDLSGPSIETILVRVTQEGEILWQLRLGGTGDDLISTILTLSDGAVLVGETTSTPDESLDMWAIRIDMNGNILWQQIFGGDRLDTARDIVQAVDGSLYIAGYTLSYGSGESDVWLIHMSADGALPQDIVSRTRLVGQADTASLETDTAIAEPAPADISATTELAVNSPEDMVAEAELPAPQPVEIVEEVPELTPADIADTQAEPEIAEIAPAVPQAETEVIPSVIETQSFSCTFHCRTSNDAHVPFPMSLDLDMEFGMSLDDANSLAAADTEMICRSANGEPDPRYSLPTCSTTP